MSLDVPIRFESEPLLWWVDDIYSADECASLIQVIEQSSPTLATNNPMFRNQDRIIRDDPAMAMELFERLRSHLSATMGKYRLVELNERLRMYRYQPGQSFSPHMDHWYQPSDTQITLHSVLVYLNDDFEGGETRFQEQLEEIVIPKPGRVAIFQLFYEKYGVLEMFFYEPETQNFWGFVRAQPNQGFTLITPLHLPWASPTLNIRFELFDDGLAVFYPNGEPFQEPDEILMERVGFPVRSTYRAIQTQRQTQEKLDRAMAKLKELGIEPEQI